MKRNLLSIVILVLLLVNTVLTVVLMVSVVGTAKKTSALIDGISEALSLEMASQVDNGEATTIPMTDIVVYTVPESMTIPMKEGADAKPHYCMLQVSLSINTKSEGYETYGSDLSPQESLIKDEVYSVVSQYTVEEAKVNQDLIKQQILEKIQAMYNSDFIFNVSFGECLFQ